MSFKDGDTLSFKDTGYNGVLHVVSITYKCFGRFGKLIENCPAFGRFVSENCRDPGKCSRAPSAEETLQFVLERYDPKCANDQSVSFNVNIKDPDDWISSFLHCPAFARYFTTRSVYCPGALANQELLWCI